MVLTAKEIQRNVQQKLKEGLTCKEDIMKKMMDTEDCSLTPPRNRSVSVDSSKFVSPKRADKSDTPEKEWEK